MPKIIENPKERLIAEARRQTTQFGYGAVTIRSVASACGIGIGTVYNYFPSKEALMAAYLLQDWQTCICAIRQTEAAAQSALPVLRCIYDQLVEYARRHRPVFQDPSAASEFAGSFSRYHGLLRSQLAEPLRRFCPDAFTADFIAEGLLTWTMAGKSFEELYGILQKLM